MDNMYRNSESPGHIASETAEIHNSVLIIVHRCTPEADIKGISDRVSRLQGQSWLSVARSTLEDSAVHVEEGFCVSMYLQHVVDATRGFCSTWIGRQIRSEKTNKNRSCKFGLNETQK